MTQILSIIAIQWCLRQLLLFCHLSDIDTEYSNWSLITSPVMCWPICFQPKTIVILSAVICTDYPNQSSLEFRRWSCRGAPCFCHIISTIHYHITRIVIVLRIWSSNHQSVLASADKAFNSSNLSFSVSPKIAIPCCRCFQIKDMEVGTGWAANLGI